MGTVKLIRDPTTEAPSPPLASDADSEPARLSPAVLGANLLNAARVDYRHSSPVRMARTPGKGRLSRVGAHTEPRSLSLARPRESVWELPESPQGKAFMLPAEINHAPLKKREKSVAESASALPSSPPRPTSQPQHQDDVHIVAHLSNGAPRCAATSYRCDKAAGPRHDQCHNSGTQSTPHGPRCTRHTRKPGPVRCEHMVSLDGSLAQCSAAGVNGTTRCAKHMSTLNSDDNARKRKAGASVEKANERHGSPKRVKKSTMGKSPAEVSRPSMEDDLVHSIEDAALAPSVIDGDRPGPKSQETNINSKSARQTGPRCSAKATKITKSSLQHHHEDVASDDLEELEEHDANMSDVSEQNANTSGPFERVFDFLDLVKRPGRCQTQLCLNIGSACDKLTSRLSKGSPSLEEAAEKIRDVQNLVLKIYRVDEEDRRAVKGDMYGHVFRSLTKLLRSLYKYLDEENQEMLSSPECIRIISHFVHDIVAAKGCIADWKIRWNSDRMVKDVDSFLIAPLRNVETFLNKHLRRLEKEDQDRRALLELKSQRTEEDKETAEKERLQKARNKRYDHWQQLHVTRMEVEPDPNRRRTILLFTKLEELGEMDANGVMFERLPVFKNRKTPPLRKTPFVVEATPWTTEQETALIDGLQEFAGSNVFHEIFRAYCKPRQLLRDFSVRDIVTKAEWILLVYTKHYQEKGWEEPPWMLQNPTFF